MNTREGMGVRSCGWIMERMEGRWPSLAPTKNSLWTEQQAVASALCPQAGQGQEGLCLQVWLPGGLSSPIN